jgi:hypothetical protein
VAGAVTVLVDQPGLVHDLQVPGDHLRGDVEVADDVAGWQRVIGDQGEDGAAVRFGERFQRCVRVYGWRPGKATGRSMTGGGPGPGGGAIKGRRRASYLGVKCREQ